MAKGKLIAAGAAVLLFLGTGLTLPALRKPNQAQRLQMVQANWPNDPYIGMYSIGQRTKVAVMRDTTGSLTLQFPATGAYPIKETSPDRFEIAGKLLVYNSEIVFTRNAQGQVDGFVMKQQDRDVLGRKER